ncbi:MAG TPA: hypothetical protein PLX53_03235, partial [Tenuifilaceae bacterium]|nr:hypothetical protein [Tenuifilaceae bacterium]
LTKEGLSNILDAVKASRRIYQRMLTYTLNKIIKTFQIALFLSVGFVLTREFVVTPLLIILLLFANDFVTMSLATDNVSYSRKPDRWKILPQTPIPMEVIIRPGDNSTVVPALEFSTPIKKSALSMLMFLNILNP